MTSHPGDSLKRLNETLTRAATLSPYYREAFRGLDLTMHSKEDLRRLPILSREELVMNAVDMLVDGCVPVTVSMSGGTTSADGKSRSVVTFHDAEEARARRATIDANYEKVNPRPLFLNLVNLGHGYDTSTAIEGAFQMAIERPFQFEVILDLLRQEFSFPGFTRRIRAIVGAVRLLKAMTLLCMQREIDAAQEFRIDLISTSSQHLTSRWRGLLADYWGAKVDETYGISEVPGVHGRRCVACGRFHFSPQAFVEILALDSTEPVDKGAGRVVGTCLYPLASMQPIIRYDTGDVIEITGECATAGTFGFEFVGRLRDLIIVRDVGSPRILLSPVTVNEIMDATPGIETEQFGFARGLGLHHGAGFQHWGLRHDSQERRLTLAIELAWSPWEYQRAAAELADSVRGQVLAASAPLQEAVTAKEISFAVELHEPGTTDLQALV